jgi:AraC family transcriptional regulator
MPLPETVPLAAAPRWSLNLSAPPTARWFTVGHHGQLPVEHYRFPGLWSLHLYGWVGVLTVDGVHVPVAPGYVGVFPLGGGVSHWFTGPAVHVSFGFALPDGDGDGSGAEGARTTVPCMADFGAEFAPLWARLERAVATGAGITPRAASLLWETLWRVAERAPADARAPADHPAVLLAREIIERRLAEPLTVRELAASVDLSHNHLTRLFQAAVGRGVAAYLRQRRVARARQLLEYSTLPIKVIAATVGLPDLHQFNKVLRAETGLSPRALRRGAGG